MEKYIEFKKWFQYIKRLTFFSTTNSIEDAPENAERRKAILLSIIRSKTRGLVRNSLAPNRPINKSYSEIVEILKKKQRKKKHFQPKTVQSYQFYTRVRKTDAPVTNFVADLKCLSVDCNFSATLVTMIQDSIVCSQRAT